MGIWQRIKSVVKKWVGGGSSKKATPPRARAIRSVSRGSNQSAGYYRGGRYNASNNEEEERKKKKTQDAFKAKEQTYKYVSTASRNDKKAVPKSVVERKAEIDANRENARKRLDSLKSSAPKHNEQKSGVKTGGYTSKERKQVRRDVVKYNPKAAGAIGGMASGLSFGATDVLGSVNEGNKYYKKHRNETAETIGELAGSVVSFGGAGKAAEKYVAKKLATKGGQKAVARIASNKLVRKSAEKAVSKAVKKGTIKAGTEALAKEVAKDKAKRLISNVAENVIVDATAGVAYDVNKATARHKLGSDEWKKEMRDNALMNVGATGIGVGLGNLRRNKTVINEALKTLPAKEAERIVKGSALSKNYLRGRLKNGNMTVNRNASDWKSALANANDFDEFVKSNAKNPDVRRYVVDERNGVDGLEKLWRDSRIAKSRESVRELNPDNTNEILGKSLPDSTRLEWFQNENSHAKPKLAHYIARDPEVLNAGMNIAYRNYADSVLGTPMSFEEWLVTPQKMYRGTTGKGLLKEDIFSSFTPDRRVAEKFAGKSADARIDEITVRPIDTLGSYAVSGEQEILVPKEAIEKAANAASNDFAVVDDILPSVNPEETVKAETKAGLKQRAEELADIPFTDDQGNPVTGDIKINKVAEEEAISGDRPIGVKQVRSAYNYTNAGQVVEGDLLTSWNEAWEASKAYSASHATGDKKRMSKVAVSQLNAMDSDAERELRQKLVDSGEMDYDAISSVELYDKIAKQMRDDPSRWVKDMIEINEGGALDFRSTPEWQARVQYIMGTVDPSADSASEIAYTEAFKLAQNISSKGGQSLNLRRNFVHLTPMGKRDAILDDLINILDRSTGFRKNHPQMDSLGHFDQRDYMRKFLMDDDEIRDGVKKLVDADDPDEVSKAFAELMLNVNKKNPKAGFDVLQELRYLNMLGNPKTHIRNIFGSAFFAPIRQTSNAIRSALEKPIERYARKASGGTVEVARHGGLSLTAAKEAWAKNPTTEAGKAALEAFNKNKAEILGSAKYETMLYKGRGKTKVGKAIDTLSDFNSNLLSGEDDFFRSRAYRENYIKSYNRYLKDGKPITEKVKRRIEQEALEESRIATFNEYNEFASFLNNITRKANDPNASVGARWGGRTVNAVMPFTKVPANLMKQSMNYSPIGIARGFANIKTAAKKGDAKALNVAIDQLASGLTGTGIFGLGMLLGKTTDLFTTNAGKNDPAAKFKKGQGVQNYSITFKDPITKETHSYTLDWLVPTSATFFSGVELANQMKKGDFNLLDIGGDWSTVVTRLAEPVMETSMLSGLHGILETMRGGSDDDDAKSAIGIFLRETAQSYLSSLVPTAVGQIARTAYKTDMQVTGDTDWEYFKNQTKSKMGLANTNILGDALGADTDLYGNVKGEKNSAGDYVKSGLKNFLSPSNIQKVDLSEVDKKKLAEYERRVKNGEDPEELAYLFPKKQYKKTFSVGNTDINMSNRDLSAYNQAKTTGGEEGMRYILENIMFNRYAEDANGNKYLTDGYTKEQKAELMKQFKGKSMREVEEWLYKQPQFKNATDAEKKKAINGLWTLSAQGKSNASQRVGEQAVYKAQGKDVNEYNFNNELSEKKRENLQPYIDAGVLTYEEAVDFARNAGKTYYYENDEGGTSQTHFNKKQMIEYLVSKGYSYEKAEALYNSFKASNAKPYSGNNLSSGRRGYGRRGYGRRRGRGGSSKAPAIKQSSFKAKKQTYKSAAEALPKASTSRSSASYKTGSIKSKIASSYSPRKTSTSSAVKIEPPKVKFKKYEV